ncbi:putative S-layer protein [Paenibacillus sp. 598K]|uniref:glycosyl hydrolase family 28-related protein n=1 Tax=Paenibacillus sp. 598K TaxID=1117987 RepID=UPI000FF9803D|nr:glycosyl hydrolase family 28-related protein [Paenibacillus sp. 598K]GBF74421.1 putative S-layer protein [Paenibacillus sp. 598K]
MTRDQRHYDAQVVQTVWTGGAPVISAFRATDFGAVGDGVTDCTAALRQAIAAAAEAGGGSIWLAAGRYRISGTLKLPRSVYLVGEWQAPPRGLGQGTILLACPPADHPEPLLIVDQSAGVVGLTIYYPEQRLDSPIPYPAAIQLGEVMGDFASIRNVTLVNPYIGILVGPLNNELHTVQNVYGCPLKVGIAINKTYDIGRIEEVHFSPEYWCDYPQSGIERERLTEWLRREAIGMRIQRSDWEYVYRFTTVDYGIGIAFDKDPESPDVTDGANGQMYGLSLTGARICIKLDYLNTIGLAMTNSRFETVTGGVAVQAGPHFASVAQFHGCSLETEGRAIAMAAAATGTLSFHQATINRHASSTEEEAFAVDIEGGTLLMNSCDFSGIERCVRLHGGVQAASVLGSRAIDAAQFVSMGEEDGRVVIDADVSRGERMAYPELELGEAPAPQGQALIVATHAPYGACPDGVRDNTAIFQDALQQLAEQGGGTLFVPPGQYRFEGSLVVPSGTEIRGVSEMPHHTMGGGTVLLTVQGEGDEEAEPFLVLSGGCGLRGVTVWHPDQSYSSVKRYPWTIQSRGRGNWLVYVTFGNSYKAVDFGSYPSGGHYIEFLAGCALREGLYIGSSDEAGWVKNVHMNPHFYFRTSMAGLPGGARDRTEEETMFHETLAYMDVHLEYAFRFGRTWQETVFNSFSYRSYVGLRMEEQDGAAFRGVLLGTGCDGTVKGMIIASTDPDGLLMINTNVDIVNDAYLYLTPPAGAAFKLKLANSIFGGYNLNPQYGIVVEGGEVHIEQAHFRANSALFRNGAIKLYNGRLHVQTCTFSHIGPIHGEGFSRQQDVTDISIGSAGEAVVEGNVAKDTFKVVDYTEGRAVLRGNVAATS